MSLNILQKINFLKYIKISFKLFIAPIVLNLAMILLGVIALNTLGELANRSRELRDIQLKKISVVTEASQSATEANFAMYQLFTLYALSSAEIEQAKKLKEQEKISLITLEKTISDLKSMDNTEHENILLEDIAALEERYKKAVQDVLDMIDIDVTMSYMYQNELRMSYEDLQTKLTELNNIVKDEVDKAFDQSVENATTAKQDFLFTLAIAVLIGLIVSYIVSRAVLAPLKKMTITMNTLAEGHTDIEIPARDYKDEIGNMAKAVEIFRDNAIRANELETQSKAAEIKTAEEKRIMMQKLADNFEESVMSIVNNVSAASTQLSSTANSMTSISENASQRSSAVAAAAEETSANVQTVAAAAEELSHSISEIARQVSEESEMARNAVKEAEETSAFISSLAEATEKISEVVQLINDIAEQTNLLALNATIEAARAGDAGKGFAVVASEVKLLASETGKATDAIAEQIADVQGKTKQAVDAISRISDVIRKIDETSASIAVSVDQQGKATQEISQNIEQSAQGTKEVSENITGVTQAANEAGNAASEVSSSSAGLAENASQLKDKVEEFIQRIRQS